MAQLFHPRVRLPRMGSRGQPEESRAAILQAAAKEFAENGIAGARTDAIAREAGVNKALLYYYFEDKEKLYGAVLDEAFSGMKANVFRVLDSDLPPREKIMAYVGAYFDFIASSQIYPKLMQREMMRAREGNSVHIDRLVKTYFQPDLRARGRTVAQGNRRGRISQGGPGTLRAFDGGDDRFLLQQCPGHAENCALQPPGAGANCRAACGGSRFYFSGSVSALGRRSAVVSQIRSTQMSARNRFFILLGIIFVIAVVYYIFSADHSKDLVLIGTVDSNQVIVSAQVEGRIQKLLVDEGTPVKAGDLIAVLDPSELQTQEAAADATITSLQNKVAEMQHTEQSTSGLDLQRRSQRARQARFRQGATAAGKGRHSIERRATAAA